MLKRNLNDFELVMIRDGWWTIYERHMAGGHIRKPSQECGEKVGIRAYSFSLL